MFRAAWLGARRCPPCITRRVQTSWISTTAIKQAAPSEYVRNRTQYREKMRELRAKWQEDLAKEVRSVEAKETKDTSKMDSEKNKAKELERTRKQTWRELIDQSRMKVKAANAELAAANRKLHHEKEAERRKKIVEKQLEQSTDFITGDDEQLQDYITRQLENPVNYNRRIEKY